MGEFLEKVEQYTVDVINGRNQTFRDQAYRCFLFLLSRLYFQVVQLRHILYHDWKLWRQHNLGCQVISVGNLTTGGTGKTPVVELIAKTVASRKKHVAILSRGYRSKDRRSFWQRLLGKLPGAHPEQRVPRVVSDGRQVLLDSEVAGDEPYMLAKNLLPTSDRCGVAVVVDKDRVFGGRYAQKHLNASILILDDGFQYLRLFPTMNILLVDSTSPFHNHEMLPCGLLREPIENMRRAKYIFLTKSDGRKSLNHLKKFFHRHHPTASLIECNHEPKHFEEVGNPYNQMQLEGLRGRKIAAFSGIAVPESFLNYLRKYGGDIVYTRHFVDHHRYRKKEIEEIFEQARLHGAEMLVTTEKDAVRLPSDLAGGLPLFFLRIEIKILDGQAEFDKCIDEICPREEEICP